MEAQGSPGLDGGSVRQPPRLDKYELLQEIGHGGMATVYRARDPRLGREVAVKLIHRHLRENAEVGTRFVAEARAAAKLRHPGIVDVYDVSNEDDPERYLVVELIRGTTLRRILQQHRDMPAEVGAAIVQHLCDAVEHAHASSIIHRDIKPENVLVELPQDRVDSARGGLDAGSAAKPPTSGAGAASQPPPSGEGATPRPPVSGEGFAAATVGDTQSSVQDVVTPRRLSGHPRSVTRERAMPRARLVDPGVVIKITDFGIAKILDAQGVTSTGQVLGSPAHMAPEQIEGGEVDARTDVFALGVLMYECLVGHLPFEGKNPAQVLRRVLEGTFAAADRERPSVGGRWARIIAAALERDPADRIGSAAQLGQQIQAELSALGVPDGRAEIAAYFADPAGYIEANPGRLVGRLTARGEAARKAADVWGAAADWNRALALAPHDLAILKRIASLTSSAGRRLLVRRAAAIVAGSAVLGLGAFAVARTLKARAGTRETMTAPPAPPATEGVTLAAPPPTPRAEGSLVSAEPRIPPASAVSTTVDPTDPAARASRPVAAPVLPPPLAAAPVPSVRDVKFTIKPKGAKLTIDGVARPGWFTEVMALSVGPHTVEVTPTKDHCCRRRTSVEQIEAPAPGKPVEPQRIILVMELNPAQVSLAGGVPRGARLTCPDIALSLGAGYAATAKLREPEWMGTCFFTAPDRPQQKVNVTLEAGETKTVAWPE